ncbi:MAG: hypothetical protein IT427_03100 [Pirellulales bacterium]|nr:hypothetical protein [Pirellulales bacterium]
MLLSAAALLIGIAPSPDGICLLVAARHARHWFLATFAVCTSAFISMADGARSFAHGITQ